MSWCTDWVRPNANSCAYIVIKFRQTNWIKIIFYFTRQHCSNKRRFDRNEPIYITLNSGITNFRIISKWSTKNKMRYMKDAAKTLMETRKSLSIDRKLDFLDAC